MIHHSRFWFGLLIGIAIGALVGRWLTLTLTEAPLSSLRPVSSGLVSDTPSSVGALSTMGIVSGEQAGTLPTMNAQGVAQEQAAPTEAAQHARRLVHRQAEAQPSVGPSAHRNGEQARADSSIPIAVPDVLKDILTDTPDIERPMSIDEAHRAISAQAKDDSWAYAMEQNIRQFFAQHPQGTTFDVWLVECRASFCELQGGNFDTNREQIVKQAMVELQQQPWIGSVSQTWSSSSSRDGILYFAYIMNWDQRNPSSAP